MEEKIEFREIIEMILKGKKVIITCVIMTILFSSIISWVVLDEKYESNAVVQLSSEVQDTGIMENYIATEFTPEIYMQRIKNEAIMKQSFKEAGYSEFNKVNLSMDNKLNTNLVELTYTNKSPNETQEHLKLLLEETKKSMNSSVKETLNQLEQTYLNESESLSSEIEQLMVRYNNTVLLNKLPEVLILQTLTSSQFVVEITDEQTNALSNLNGELQNELSQLIAQIDTKSTEYRNVLAKYQSVKTGLDSFKPDPFIRVIIEPTLPESPSAPNKIINTFIGIVLGLLIGITIIAFQEFWHKGTRRKKDN